MYNTVIFDLYDTLTDDRENIRQAFEIVLEYRKENYTDEKFERFYSIDKKTWKDRAAGKLITPYEDNIKKGKIVFVTHNKGKSELAEIYKYIKETKNK